MDDQTPDPEATAGERGRVARVYGRYAGSARKQRNWRSDNPGNVAIRAELVDAVFDLAGPNLLGARNVLDVGCGTGWWLERLVSDARVTARIHGVELLPERVEAARRRAPRATVASGDARELPYDEGSFDVVTLFTVLSSLSGTDDVQAVLREARRTVTPTGTLLVWEPTLPNPFNPATMLISRKMLSAALPGAQLETRSTTLVPSLARRLGSHTDRWYPRLAGIRTLKTHRLVCARMSDAPPPTGR